MAFHIVTGVMGSGKSYYGAELCLQAAKEGATVHTNLPLVQEQWEALGLWDKVVILPHELKEWVRMEERDGHQIPTSDLLVGGEEGRENIMVVDEASLLFDIDDQMKNRASNKPIFQLVALCRHVGLDLFFLAQHQANVDAKLRRMAETRTRCVKTERIPLVGWLVAPLLGTFLRVVYMGEGTTPYAKTWHRFREEVGKAYRTHGMRESVGMRIEATRKSKGDDSAKSSGKFWFFLLVGLCLSGIGFGLFRMSGRYSELRSQTEPQNSTKPADSPAAASTPNYAKSTVPQVAPSTTRSGLREIEWLPEDELQLQAVVRTRRGMAVYAFGHIKLEVGGHYRGEKIKEVLTHAGWWYAETQYGRIVCVRPITPQERAVLPPPTVQGVEPDDAEKRGREIHNDSMEAASDSLKTLFNS